MASLSARSQGLRCLDKVDKAFALAEDARARSFALQMVVNVMSLTPRRAREFWYEPDHWQENMESLAGIKFPTSSSVCNLQEMVVRLAVVVNEIFPLA